MSSLSTETSSSTTRDGGARSDSELALTAILAPIQDDMAAVDRCIRTHLHSKVPLIEKVADYLISAGGKRLRPAVLLLMARSLGAQGNAAHTLATVIEFIHSATLLHDDVVDESELRRGHATSNALFGNAASVLVGDFLYSRAFQLMVEVGQLDVLRVLADATNRIAEGEVLQLLNVHDASINETRYFDVADRKTATLFEAAARIAALIAGGDQVRVNACACYGGALGKAFQIIDDVLDYSGDPEVIGKRLGDDLRQGKATLPLIHALQTASSADRATIEVAIEEGGGDFAAIAKIVQSCGSLDYARHRAQEQCDLARRAAQTLPANQCRDSLIKLTAFAVQRAL